MPFISSLPADAKLTRDPEFEARGRKQADEGYVRQHQGED